jgi:hypothetical protein
VHALTQTRDLLCRSQALCRHATLLKDFAITLRLFSYITKMFHIFWKILLSLKKENKKRSKEDL